MFARIETKVYAMLAGFLAGGGATGSFGLWLLGVLVFGAPHDAAHADDAIAAVPWPVAKFAPILAGAVVAAFVGYKAAPSNHAGNNATGEPMDDLTAGHAAEVPAATFPFPMTTKEG